MSQLATDIVGYIALGVFWIPFLAFWCLFVVYFIVSTIKTTKLKKEYYKTLSREDKDIIDAYNAIEWSIFKNHKKNEEKK